MSSTAASVYTVPSSVHACLITLILCSCASVMLYYCGTCNEWLLGKWITFHMEYKTCHVSYSKVVMQSLSLIY